MYMFICIYMYIYIYTYIHVLFIHTCGVSFAYIEDMCYDFAWPLSSYHFRRNSMTEVICHKVARERT